MTLIRTPRQSKRLPKAITVEQVERLLAAPDDSDTLGARDRAMLETLYSTGIRVSELVGLNLDDLDEAGEALRVRGKGKKERLVPLGAHAMARSPLPHRDPADPISPASGTRPPDRAPRCS
jgi:site-specific recombinase XerD